MYKTGFILAVVIGLFGVNRSVKAQTDTVDIYDMTLEQLSKLKVISASKTMRETREVPASVYIITANDIRERGYITLEDALADLPGFQFRNIQGINSYAFQRGIPNQNNLILLLIDGIQVNELNSGGYYGGALYNLNNAERIEIVYGPASVIYGTNAVSGIVNIITREARENQGEIAVQGGSFSTLRSHISAGAVNTANTLGIRLSGMYNTSRKADLKGINGNDNWTYDMDNFENDYHFSIRTKAYNFTQGTDYLQRQASTATLIKSAGTIYKDYGTLWNIRFINNFVKYHSNLSDKITMTATLYNRDATVLPNTVYYVTDTAQIGYYRPNNLTGIEHILGYKPTDNFSINCGVIGEYEQLAEKYSLSFSDTATVTPPKPAHPAMKKNFLESVFIEPAYNLFSKLFVSGGARCDYSSVYGNVITLRAGASYVLKKQIFRLSYAEAFRAPKPWDYTDGTGNSKLLPEKLNSLEAAMSFSVKEHLKIDVMGYKNLLYNAIVREIDGNSYKWVNEGIIKTDGLDIALKCHFPSVKAQLNYTFNNSTDANGAALTEISKHSGNALLTYTYKKIMSANIRAQYLGERLNPVIIQTTATNKIQPAVIFHCNLTVLNLKHFNMQLSVRNILNTEYYHPSNRMPDIYRQSQRTFLISLGYIFNKNQKQDERPI